MNFGAYLKELRDAAGLKKKEFAQKLEVTDGMIRFSYGAPVVKVTTDPDGKQTNCFDLAGHRFLERRDIKKATP